MLAGCSTSVIADHPGQEARYDRLWNADWERFSTDEAPLVPSKSSPGVCNAGGNKEGCYEVDSKLVSDYRRLLSDLSGSVVPPEFSQGNETARTGIQDEIVGLLERNADFKSPPGVTFAHSDSELKKGALLLQKAKSEFRGNAVPSFP